MVLELRWSYLNVRISKFGVWQYTLNVKDNGMCLAI